MNQTRNENKILRKVSRTFSTKEIQQEDSLLKKMYVLKKGKKHLCAKIVVCTISIRTLDAGCLLFDLLVAFVI